LATSQCGSGALVSDTRGIIAHLFGGCNNFFSGFGSNPDVNPALPLFILPKKQPPGYFFTSVEITVDKPVPLCYYLVSQS